MQYVQATGSAENLINTKPFWWGDHHLVVDSDDIKRLIESGFFTATENDRGVALETSPKGIKWFRENGIIDNFSQLNRTRWISFYQQEHAMRFKLTWG